MRKIAVSLAGAMLMMGMASAANALTITIKDEVHTAITFTDGDINDSASSDVGHYLLSGDINYNNFHIKGLEVKSNPFTGSGFDVNQFASTFEAATGNNAIGKLSILISGFDYVLSPNIINNATLSAPVSGTIKQTGNAAGNSTVTYKVNYNGNSVFTDGPFTANSAGSFSGGGVMPLVTTNPFDLSQEFIINFAKNETVTTVANLDLTTTPVPEPGTMVLLGAGMLGLAIFGKRRMNKDA